MSDTEIESRSNAEQDLSKLADSVKEPASEDSSSDQEQESKQDTPRKLTAKELGPGWLDILENGDLLKKVLQKGDESAARPERGARAIIDIKTRLKDKPDVLIQSDSGEDMEVFIGDGDLNHGIDLLLPLMYPGEISNVIISPRFGYGETGKGKDIPPMTYLDCIVQLKSWEVIDLEDGNISLEERIRIGAKKKDRGNFWYSREDWSSAIQCYQSALKFLSVQGEGNDIRRQYEELKKNEGGDQLEVEKLGNLLHTRAAAFNNLAAAQMKIEAFNVALNSVDSVLELEPSNIKALFRKGKILSEMGEVDAALKVLNTALALGKKEENQTEIKIIQKEVAKLSAKQQDQRRKERELAKRMFRDINNPKNSSQSTNSASNKKIVGWGFVAAAAVAAASAVAYRFILSQ